MTLRRYKPTNNHAPYAWQAEMDTQLSQQKQSDQNKNRNGECEKKMWTSDFGDQDHGEVSIFEHGQFACYLNCK